MLVACNALTGVDALGVADEAPLIADGSPDDDRTTNTNDGGSGVDAPATADRDTPKLDADAGGLADAAAETAPPPVEAGPCVATSVGPRYGSMASGLSWTEDNGALAPDNSRAHSNGDNANPLFTSGYGFGLPAGAEVQGIRVFIARNAEGAVSDKAVALPKGNPKANGAWPAGPYTGPFVTTTYGSPVDLWGATWTAADINSPSFGVSLEVNGGGDGHVDSIAITVDYCVR
jgi:hypothetical protein